jgi:parvulin-like peptidyl-prolyl isomerase
MMSNNIKNQNINLFWRGLAKPSPARSLVFCSVGAFLGLAIAGFGLFTAGGTRTSHVPSADVALVNGVPILMSDFISQVNALYGVPLSQATPEQRTAVLNAMIREELYVQRGIELGLQNDVIEVRQALVGAVEAQQIVNAIATPVSEAEMRATYAHNPDRYSTEGRLALDDYIAPDLAKANSAVNALRTGQDLSAAIAAQGLVPSGLITDGNEFYFAAKIHLGNTLFSVARSLQQGQVADPIEVSGRWHVVIIRQNIRPQLRPFDALKDKLMEDVRDARTAHLHETSEGFLLKRADILVAKGYQQ